MPGEGLGQVVATKLPPSKDSISRLADIREDRVYLAFSTSRCSFRAFENMVITSSADACLLLVLLDDVLDEAVASVLVSKMDVATRQQGRDPEDAVGTENTKVPPPRS